MKFKPLNLDNLKGSVWPEGAYKFQVEDAAEVTGNYGDQIELKLKVKDEAGNLKSLKTWLGADSPALGFFCQSVDLLPKYNTGEIHDGDCMRKVGYLELVITERNGEKYNKVSKFIVKSEYEDKISKVTSASMEPSAINDTFDDDVPF